MTPTTRDRVDGAHRCPGLVDCFNHPRWHVWQALRWSIKVDYFTFEWYASPPMSGTEPRAGERTFASHAEAVTYATERARVDQLAAIESQPGEVLC